jgi:polyhydroxyalkanoate synthesis regulator phasin
MADLVDLFKKTMLTGVGLALRGKDEIEELFKEFEDKLNLKDEEGHSFLAEFKSKIDETQDKLEQRVEQAVKEFMKKADLVTGAELNALKKEIRELKKAIGERPD